MTQTQISVTHTEADFQNFACISICVSPNYLKNDRDMKFDR